jgi:repressor of nif and glnA expression
MDNGVVERKQLAVLKVLKEADRPLSSAKIADQLFASGYDLSERTVRLYLKELDKQGMTENLGHRGRRITEHGLRELASSRIIEKVGFLSAKIDQLACEMDFDPATRNGTVVVNVALFSPDDLIESASLMGRVFKEGFAMGRLMGLFAPGERIGEVMVPEGMLGVGTVCSISLNGVLLRRGIPTVSRFGGLLELHEKKPTRFVQMINYDGTSLDPLEIFIGSGMTDYLGAITSGNGLIGASFREFPAVSRNRVVEIAERLEEVGLGGLLRIGWPSHPLLEIPVQEGRVGAIIAGGLNPVAVMVERGKRLDFKALSGLVVFDRLFPYHELDERVRDLV